MRLLILFLILPVLEIALFIQVGGLIGLWPTVGLVILAILLGVTLMRRQGIAAATNMQKSMQEIGDPTAPLAKGAMTMIAGILLIIPGFLTDITALLLLIPAVQRWAMRRMGQSVRVSPSGFGANPFNGGRDAERGSAQSYRARTIDAEYVVVEDDEQQPKQSGPRRPSGWTQH